MFFTGWFTKKKKSVNSIDTTLAAAVLLYEIIRADSVIDAKEMHIMQCWLQSRFALTSEQASVLAEKSKNCCQQSTSLHPYTRTICAQWNNQQRCELLASFWKIALADQTISADERHIVRKIAALLYLTDRDINIAKV